MTEDDTPEALEARCWALRERAERAESERDKALAVNKLLVEALEKADERLDHVHHSQTKRKIKEALAAVKQP